jgi:hypothetical protein
MRSLSRWSAAVALTAGLSVPASAQIISTSVPKDGSVSSDKKWHFHVMASPFAKWEINDYAAVPCFGRETCVGVAEAKATSLLGAAEVAFQATDSLSISAGGWYNKIGTEKPQYGFVSLNTGQVFVPTATDEDLGSISEIHLGIFYKDFGLQGGTIWVSHELTAGQKRTDTDGYLVYKPSFGKLGVSVGIGGYQTGTVDALEIDKISHLAGFATVSARIYKGLSIDGSFWLINKSKDAKDLGLSDGMTRYMVGIGYSL